MALAGIAVLPGKLNGANSRVAIMKYHDVRYLCRYIMLFEKKFQLLIELISECSLSVCTVLTTNTYLFQLSLCWDCSRNTLRKHTEHHIYIIVRQCYGRFYCI